LFFLLRLLPFLEFLLAHQPLLVNVRAPTKEDVAYIRQRLKRFALTLLHLFGALFGQVGVFVEEQRIYNPTDRSTKRALNRT
jgi:hypothetical protein